MHALVRPLDSRCLWLMLACLFWMGARALGADTHYVSLDGGNVPPYTNGWASAATNIQDAIDHSLTTAGDTVLVSNGVYQTGGKTNYPTGSLLTNRVAIYKAVTVKSFNNDPATTIIKGSGPCGPAAVRCVFLGNNCGPLVGFTLTEGATLTNNTPGGTDTMEMNGAGVCGTLWYTGINISNCLIIGNTAQSDGGGVHGQIVYNSLIASNTAVNGAGAKMSYTKIYNSILRHNRGATGANSSGGGVFSCQLFNCIVAYNDAVSGSGGSAGTYYNCLFYGNGNYALYGLSVVYNCTIVGNAGGMYAASGASVVYNSIIYSNNNNIFVHATGSIGLTNSCTFPTQSVWHVSNTTNDPLFLANGSGYGTNLVPGNYHLPANSPCVNKGTNFAWMSDPADVRSRDIDGRMRIRYGTADMGAYETIYKGIIFKGH